MIEHALLPEGNWIPTRCEDCPFCGKMDPDEESVYRNQMDPKAHFCALCTNTFTVYRPTSGNANAPVIATTTNPKVLGDTYEPWREHWREYYENDGKGGKGGKDGMTGFRLHHDHPPKQVIVGNRDPKKWSVWAGKR